MKTFQPISCHWSLSIPPENIGKSQDFCFQGVKKETSGMKWVEGAFSVDFNDP